MNWLAHIVISKNHIDYQLGNLLADPLKGREWKGASRQTREGFAMHKIIDSFTDNSQIVRKSKSRFKGKRYLSGVVVDVVYDYLLVKNWSRYCSPEFDTFISDFSENASAAIVKYPPEPSRFVRRIINSGVLERYDSIEGVKHALQGIDYRLSDRVLSKESTSDYFSGIESEIHGLQDDFLQFFPELIAHFRRLTQLKDDNHWLK